MLQAFFKELRRRRVFRVAAAYTVMGWVLVQVVTQVFPALDVDPDFTKGVVILIIIGLPVALVLAWAYDITPQGVKRTDATDGPPGASHIPMHAPLAAASRPPAIAYTQPRPRAPVSAEPVEMVPPDPERVRRASLAHLRHELRTPINAILGYSEMLLEDLPDEADSCAADLRTIHVAGQKLLGTIDHILTERAGGSADDDFDEVRQKLHYDLREPISAVIGYAEMLIEGCRDTSRDDLVPDIERIHTAANRLLSMIDDLVLMSSGDAAPESAEFKRASAIAERVLGQLHTVDIGAVQTRMLSEGTLLVIDDSPMNCDLISRQLARFGFTVATAGSGREALNTLRERDFDLVLLDILMPEMDGVEVLRLLRQEARHQDLPVIVMSSLDDVSSLVRCLEFGADDYLVKPVDATLLSVRVGALLQLKRARQREQVLLDALERERTFSNDVLGGMLPDGVLARFRSGESPILDACPETTVLAAVLEGFSRMATRQGSGAAITRAQLLTAFDDCAQRHHIDVAIATGDMYIAAAGVPLPTPDHALRTAAFALELQSIAQSMLADGDETIQPRMGLHCGPLFAGTVRTRHPSYDVWGEARETARGVALHAAPGTIHVSPAAYARLHPLFKLQARGVVDVPGHGQMRTYRLIGSQVVQTA